MSTIKELWLPIKGYEGLYEVSNTGYVRSIRKNRIIECCVSTKGYRRVCLSKDTTHKFIGIHRLVAQSFIPNPNNLTQVNHIDGEKLNNCVENLEWCNNSQNQKHAYDNGLKKKKLSKDNVEFIRRCYIPRDREFGTRGLARKFNVTQSSIRYVLKSEVM